MAAHPIPAPAPDSDLSWATRPSETVLAGIGGVVLAGLGFTADPTGRWLVWAAAALLLGICAVDVVLRPRLAADGWGVTVRSLGRRRSAPWPRTVVALRRHQRFGRTVPTLELDLDEQLVILGRRELGTDPEEVAAQLSGLRAAGGTAGD